jgi:hypothetical protein
MCRSEININQYDIEAQVNISNGLSTAIYTTMALR